MKKTISIMIILLIFISNFIIINFENADAYQNEVHNFNRIWYHPTIGFNKNGQGTLIIATTYTNNTLRTINSAYISYTQDPFYLSLLFEDEQIIIRDTEGDIIYMEPIDGYIYLKKNVVDNHFPDDIKKFASKNLRYKTIIYQGDLWYRIYIPSFNKEYSWREFQQPIFKEKWFTWGNNNSIIFKDKAMFIELIKDHMGSIELDFSHPNDTSGQIVAFSKSFLNSKGIYDPYFEWGDKITWQILDFQENDTHYLIRPKHFSIIGVHQASSGIIYAGVVDNNLSSTGDTWTLNTSVPETILEETSFGANSKDGIRWQSFSEPDAYVITKIGVRTWQKAFPSIWLNIRDNSGTITYVNKTGTPNNGWTYLNVDDTVFQPGITYKIYTGGNRYWYYEGNTYPNGTSSFSSSNDFSFKLYGYYLSNGTRSAGSSSERNIINDTLDTNLSTINTTSIIVPVSNSVQAITEVLNQTSMITASEVNSTSELINNTFFYDSANQFVYIGTNNLSDGQNINWSVNCSYGSEFSISFPSYKNVGDDIFLIGVIKDSNGDGINGIMAKTYIYYQNGSIAIGPIEWNCTGGNYQTVINTNSLTPGTYSISVEFTDSISGLTFKEGNTLYLSVAPGGGVYVWSFLHFTFYNNNTGIGIPSESFKIYASTDTTIDSDDRIFRDLYNVYTGQIIYYRIDDYFNNQIYPTVGSYKTLEIITTNQYEEIPIDWHSFSVKNMNHSIVLFNMTNASRTYSQYLFPYEPFYWDILEGEYTINLTYKNPETDVIVGYNEENITINSDKYYWIRGYDLRDIIIEIQFTNASLENFSLSITTDISLINSTVNSITTDIVTNISLMESNLTTLNNQIWNAINITDSVVDYINNTIWTEISAINLTVDYINNTIWTELGFINSSINNITINATFNLSFINSTVGNIQTYVLTMWNMQNSSFKNLENRSIVEFSFYNTNEGLGLDRETLKVYINGSRLIGNTFICYNESDVINVTIKDYYNNTLFHQNFTISAPFTHIDLGLTFHYWLFGNKGDDYWFISILKEGATRWWEKGVTPYNDVEFMIPSGNYTMRVYNKTYYEIHNQSYIINNSRIYLIHGTNLSLIASGLSIVRKQLLDFRAEFNYYVTPEIVRVCDNSPMIFSIYDPDGMILDDIPILLCPALITKAGTFNETFSNNFNSIAKIPGNDTVENGTISILKDTLYLSGSANWVNISYTDNWTLMQNTSYVPISVMLSGENVTINASSNITIRRETRYQQVKKFDWLYYQHSGWGPIPERAGWHTAGIEVNNPMNIPIFDVYVFVQFSDETNPDTNTIQVYELDNDDNIIEGGLDYDVTEKTVQFYHTSIPANSSIHYKISYYKSLVDSYEYGEDRYSVYSYETTTYKGHSYHYFNVNWHNPRTKIFNGGLFVKIEFEKPQELDDESVIVVDQDNNNRELVSRNYVVGTNFIRIDSEAMGNVPGGSGRNFRVYFIFKEYPGGNPKDTHLDTPFTSFLGLPISWFFIITIIGLILLIIGIVSLVKTKSTIKKKSSILIISLGIFIIVIFFVLNTIGI